MHVCYVYMVYSSDSHGHANPQFCPVFTTSRFASPASCTPDTNCESQRYPIFKDPGSKNHTLNGFGTRVLRYWVLGPSGSVCQLCLRWQLLEVLWGTVLRKINTFRLWILKRPRLSGLYNRQLRSTPRLHKSSTWAQILCKMMAQNLQK